MNDTRHLGTFAEGYRCPWFAKNGVPCARDPSVEHAPHVGWDFAYRKQKYSVPCPHPDCAGVILDGSHFDADWQLETAVPEADPTPTPPPATPTTRSGRMTVLIHELRTHATWTAFWLVVALVGACGMIGSAIASSGVWSLGYGLIAAMLLHMALDDAREIVRWHDVHVAVDQLFPDVR